MSSRREFILSCSALAAVAAVAPLGALEGLFNFGLPVASIDQLSFAELAAQVNTRFRVYATPARVVELELVEASLDPGRPQHGRRTPPDADCEKFSLFFTGPRNELLDQKILKFEHDRLGRFELLVLPIFTRKPDRMNYQAVFNRPRKPCQTLNRATPAGTGLKA
jgi:hypothetical protein